MFSYIPKSMWFPTSVDVKEAATIEALLKLCKDGEVERVIIPNTYYGYGASLIDDSNRRSIARHYRANKLKSYGYALTMSAWQFINKEELRELVEELQEQYPIFDESDYSELETETKLDFIVDEIAYELVNDETSEVLPLLPATLQETKDYVRDVLESRDADYSNRIDWWEYVTIDNDGATPYALKTDIQALAEMVKAKASEGWKK